MNWPEDLYFNSYKELLRYCYGLIKIDEKSILSRVDSDFERYFEKESLYNKGIKDYFMEDSIFYQYIDDFGMRSPISLKRIWVSNFRHQYTNYDEVLNYLTTPKVKSLTSLRYVQIKDLVYYRYSEYVNDLDDLEDLSNFDSIPIRKAIYVDIKFGVSDSIGTTCTLRIYERYENERLRKQEAERQRKIEKERLLEESIKIQEEIINLNKVLYEKFNGFGLNTTYPIKFKRDASENLNSAIKWGIFLPTSWISLMFLYAIAAIIFGPSSETSQDILRIFGTFIFSIILGLPYLIPLTKFLIFYFQYLEQKQIYLSNLQNYRKSCFSLINQYDDKVAKFYQITRKMPICNTQYGLKEIDRKIKELQE